MRSKPFCIMVCVAMIGLCLMAGEKPAPPTAPAESDLRARLALLLSGEEFKEDRVEILRMGKPAVRILGEMLTDGITSDIVAARALMLLAEMGVDAEALRHVLPTYLLRSDNFVRLNAVRTMGKLDAAFYVPSYVAMLDDSYEPVQRSSIEVLKNQPSLAGKGILEAWIARPDMPDKRPSKDVINEAKEAVAAIAKAMPADANGVAETMRRLRSEKAGERLGAVRDISKVQGKQGDAVLVLLIGDPSGEVAAEAMKVLGERHALQNLVVLQLWLARYETRTPKGGRDQSLEDAARAAIESIRRGIKESTTAPASQPDDT